MTTTIFTFPFEQIGSMLRTMSLSGAAGNVAAIIIYACISLLPVLAYLVLWKKQMIKKADGMLFLLSIVLFYVLYYSINPGLFTTLIPGTSGIFLGGVFYSVLVTYGVIRIQNMAMSADKSQIQGMLKGFLYLLAVLFGAAAILELAVSLPAAMEQLKEANESSFAVSGLFRSDALSTIDPKVSYAFAVMESVVNVVPYILDIIIIFQALHLIKELQNDWYSEESVQAAKKLAVSSGRNLAIAAVMGMVFNILQTLCRNYITDTNIVVNLPIFSIIFMLAILLAARYIRASQELKTDNDLFI